VPLLRLLAAARVLYTSTPQARESCIHYTGEFPDLTTISAHEVLRLRSAGTPVLLVDVRLPEEQEVSIIEGAVAVDAFESAGAAGQQYSPAALLNTIVVPYCTIGYRSGLYARKLRAAGYAQVRNGEGVVMWTHDVSQHAALMHMCVVVLCVTQASRRTQTVTCEVRCGVHDNSTHIVCFFSAALF
jgi:rhodanese-related sulfurtransferase